MYNGCLEVGLDRFTKVGETAFVTDDSCNGDGGAKRIGQFSFR